MPSPASLGDKFLSRISAAAPGRRTCRMPARPLAPRHPPRRPGGLLPDLRRPHLRAERCRRAATRRRHQRTAGPRRLRPAPAQKALTSCAAARCWPARAWHPKPTACPTLEAALMKASDNGRYPVIMDASACTTRMQKHLAGRLKLYDFHEFAHDALLPRLMIIQGSRPDRAARQLQRAQEPARTAS
jgi:hypothetical protein